MTDRKSRILLIVGLIASLVTLLFLNPTQSPGMLGLGGGGVSSVQHVSISILNADTSGTATITAVDTTRAHIIHLGNTGDQGIDEIRRFLIRVDLQDSTTVRAQRNTAGSGGGTLTVDAVVVEWKAGSLKSLQTGTVTVDTAATSGTATVTAVTTTKSMLFHLGVTSDATAVTEEYNTRYRLTLTNTTTVTATRRTSTSGGTATVGFVLVESN